MCLPRVKDPKRNLHVRGVLGALIWGGGCDRWLKLINSEVYSVPLSRGGCRDRWLKHRWGVLRNLNPRWLPWPLITHKHEIESIHGGLKPRLDFCFSFWTSETKTWLSVKKHGMLLSSSCRGPLSWIHD